MYSFYVCEEESILIGIKIVFSYFHLLSGGTHIHDSGYFLRIIVAFLFYYCNDRQTEGRKKLPNVFRISVFDKCFVILHTQSRTLWRSDWDVLVCVGSCNSEQAVIEFQLEGKGRQRRGDKTAIERDIQPVFLCREYCCNILSRCCFLCHVLLKNTDRVNMFPVLGSASGNIWDVWGDRESQEYYIRGGWNWTSWWCCLKVSPSMKGWHAAGHSYCGLTLSPLLFVN